MTERPTLRRKTIPTVYTSPVRIPLTAEQIKAARKEMGLTQAQLTQLLDVTSEISRMECGATPVTKYVEHAILTVLEHYRKTKRIEPAETIKRSVFAEN